VLLPPPAVPVGAAADREHAERDDRADDAEGGCGRDDPGRPEWGDQ